MKRLVLFLSLILITLGSIVSPAAAQSPVVRAVLFYSPTCPHCHEVMKEHLPLIIEEYTGPVTVVSWPPVEGDVLEEWPDIIAIYGEKLELIYIHAGKPLGSELYNTTDRRFNIPSERQGVPRMVIGETVLVGAIEIPEIFPALIKAGLESGGIPWPDIDGLDVALSLAPRPSETSSSDPGQVLPEDKFSPLEKFKRDPVGNTLAVIVLLGMIVSLGFSGFRFRAKPAHEPISWKWWAIPLLSIGGALISGYLTSVEASGSSAFCGPIGDCNAVQQSRYAVLFGTFHISLLGLVGYVAILAAWLVAHFGKNRVSHWAKLSILGLAVFGTAFSIYLTFLEPFVIGATCSWCLVSAIVITAQARLATNPAAMAWSQLQKKRKITKNRR